MDRSVCQKSPTPQLPCVGIMEMIGQCWKWTFLPVHIPFPTAHLSFPRLNNGIVELYCCEPHAKVGISDATCTASGGKCSALSVWISNAFSVGQSISQKNTRSLVLVFIRNYTVVGYYSKQSRIAKHIRVVSMDRGVIQHPSRTFIYTTIPAYLRPSAGRSPRRGLFCRRKRLPLPLTPSGGIPGQDKHLSAPLE
jgi:hypothetical protein